MLLEELPQISGAEMLSGLGGSGSGSFAAASASLARRSSTAVMALYYGVDHWNAWFNVALCIRSRDLYPLKLTLREILISSDVSQMLNLSTDAERISETVKHAVIVLVTLPILCLHPFLQKHFVKGVMIGAAKG